jgi:uncharacterized OB-fold protein
MTAYISLPAFQKTIDQRYRVIGAKCTSCGEVHFPQRLVCMKCGSREFETMQLSGLGEVHTFTILARGGAPTEFDDQQTMTGEMAVAVVELDEGPKIMGQITGCSPRDVEIGQKMQAVMRRLYVQEGIVRYGYKFQPVKQD